MKCKLCGSNIRPGDEFVRDEGVAVCMDCLPDFAELLGFKVYTCEHVKEDVQLPGQMDIFGGVVDG